MFFAAQVLVEKLGWLPNGVFLELLALCQCLPGPSSTQLSFALGVTQQGTVGGLLSGGVPFLLPCRAPAYFPGVPARLRMREQVRFRRRGRSPSSPTIVRQRRRPAALSGHRDAGLTDLATLQWQD